mgnify:CR=1 FL=1
MRTASLVALAIFFPAFVWAAALVNINTATAALLDTLPGIGPSKAASIIDYRTKNGPFSATSDIQKVSGIGPVTFAKLEKLITVDMTNSISVVTPPAAQPSEPPTSYKKVQKVEPVISTKDIPQTHEEAVTAPAVATELAPAGATLPPPVPASRASGMFRSPWALGLLGVIVVAGAAFILI